MLFLNLGFTFYFSSLKNINDDLKKNYVFKDFFLFFNYFPSFLKFSFFYNNFYSSFLNNFYISNLISNFSKTMSLCNTTLKKKNLNILEK